MKTKTNLLTLVLLFLFQFILAQNTGNIQDKFNLLIKEIDELAKSGQINEAIKKGEAAREFAFENFKNSRNNQKAILYKLNFFYRITRDSDNELESNIAINKLRQEDLIAERESFASSLSNLIAFYKDIENPREVIPVFKQANESITNHVSSALEQRFTDEKTVFLNENILPYFYLFQSFAYKTNYKYKTFNNLLINNTLLSKGALLNASKDILKKLKSLEDPLISEKVATYIREKEYIAYQLSLDIKNRNEDLSIRTNRLSGLESELLTLHASTFKGEIKRPINWRRTPLQEDEIVLEFSRFNLYDKKWTDSIIYVAQLFKKEWRYPKIIPLFEEKELSTILNKKSTTQIYQSRGSKGKRTNATNYAKEIYQLLIKPLEEDLKGNSKIYISPDGLLHQIAFAALINSENTYLIEDFIVEQVSSSRVVTRENQKNGINNFLLVGGINYDYDSKGKTELIKTNASSLKGILKHEDALDSPSNSWSYLKGTAEEITGIETLLKPKAKQVKLLKGDDATETAIKLFSGQAPQVMHLATHGFFFEDSTSLLISEESNTNQFKYSDNPLLRSGILLAHANYAWRYGTNPYEKDDGILTALEISNLDLSNTELVILSACETGLGDISGNEGVYGLQRSLKLAGVKYIIMSLWEVPDLETSEFMQEFYAKWLQDGNLKEVFVKTQRTMLKKYPEAPEKWAAFVLVE